MSGNSSKPLYCINRLYCQYFSSDELLLAQQQVRRGEKDHREEMSRMHDMTLELQQENEELKQELVKVRVI